MKDIDKFFRKQLKQGAAQPKAESWDQLADMLDEQASPSLAYWKVAVAVLLVMGIVIPLYWYDTLDAHVQLAEENHQNLDQTNSADVPVTDVIDTPIAILESPKPTKYEEKTPKIPQTAPQRQPIAVVEMPKETINEPITTNIMPEALTVVINEELVHIAPSDQLRQANKKKIIKITYKRGTQSSDQMIAKVASDTSQRRSIKAFIAKGKGVDPAAMLASIRDAKDEFIHRKFHKKEVKNSNK